MGDMTREPSMEEILSSIRRVIARDEDAMGGAPLADSDEEILELTDTDTDTDTDALPASGLVNDVDADNGATTTAINTATSDTLVSEVSAEASRQSLNALTAMLSSDAEPIEKPVGQSGDMTLNAMAEAMLRPMLKSWLDANLPSMVEKLVSREIARITGNRF